MKVISEKDQEYLDAIKECKEMKYKGIYVCPHCETKIARVFDENWDCETIIFKENFLEGLESIEYYYDCKYNYEEPERTTRMYQCVVTCKKCKNKIQFPYE